MAIIDYDRWMKDTNRFGINRSKELKAIDTAFLAFAKLGTNDSKAELQKAFDTWKQKEGPGDKWRKSSRNHKQAVEKLSALLKGLDDNDSAFNKGLVPDFMHEELINARLGVLYLFSRVSVEGGIFKMVLDSGLDIAGQAMEIGQTSEKAQDIFGKAGKAKGAVGFGLNKLESKLVAQNKPQNIYLDPQAKSSILAGKGASTVTSVQIQQELDAAQALANRPFMDRIRSKVQEWFDALVEKVIAMLRQKFGTVEGIAGTLKQVIKGIVTLVAAKAAPFVGAGMEIASSLAKTVDAAVTRFRMWQQGKNVDIADGHPSTIIQSITLAMNASLFEGLWQTLKGAGSLAMDIVGFGAGGLVNLIISCSEMLLKFAWRLFETVRINRFCKEALGYWNNSNSLDSIHRRPYAFSEWYRSTALTVPFISVMTLNTGICGDKMRYLSMFASGGKQISSTEFLAGAKFLDNLKPWGANYLDQAGYKVNSGGDILVGKLVNDFATSHSKEKSVFDTVISVITA